MEKHAIQPMLALAGFKNVAACLNLDVSSRDYGNRQTFVALCFRCCITDTTAVRVNGRSTRGDCEARRESLQVRTS